MISKIDLGTRQNMCGKFHTRSRSYQPAIDTRRKQFVIINIQQLSACPGCAKPDLLDAGDCGPGDAPPGPVWVHELGIPNLVLDIHILAATKLIPTPLL